MFWSSTPKPPAPTFPTPLYMDRSFNEMVTRLIARRMAGSGGGSPAAVKRLGRRAGGLRGSKVGWSQ